MEFRGIESSLLDFREVKGFVQFLVQKRARLFQQIHEIVFYGKGGYDFDTVYNLPIWLRRFVYRSILEHYEKEAESTQGNLEPVKKAPNIPKEAFQKPDMVVRRPASK